MRYLFKRLDHLQYSVAAAGTKIYSQHAVLGQQEAPPAAEHALPAKGAKKVVQARIPWRRRDLLPAAKNIIVVDAATGARITNVLSLDVSREFGLLLLEPKTVPGDYYVYYMPYKPEGRKNYPNVKYDPPEATEDPGWKEKVGQIPLADIPRAGFVEIQSADAFSAFTPMERIATAAETKALLAAHPGAPYLLFPENRARSIRMTGTCPIIGRSRDPGESSEGKPPGANTSRSRSASGRPGRPSRASR